MLIAAYLVYHLRVRSNDALRYVRLKRPGAVQTRRQIECVKEFEAYFLPQVSNAVLPEIRGGAKKITKYATKFMNANIIRNLYYQ